MDKHAAIAREVDAAAERLDIYAANKKLTDEPNNSKLVIHNNVNVSEGGERTYKPHLGVFLHMPNVQEKVQLRFTSYDEDVTERGINEHRYQSDYGEEAYGGSVAFFQELGNVKTEFRPRLEYIDELQTSYLFKFWSEAQRGDFFMEPELQLFARSDTGTGQFIGLNCGLELGEQDKLLFVNEEQYTDGDNTMTTNHGLEWDHVYDKVFEHENSIIFEGTNRDTFHHEKFTVRSKFLHRWRMNVLHYSVTPYVVFLKERKFRGRLGMDLRVEVIF